MSKVSKEISQNDELAIEIGNLYPRQGEWTEEDYFHLPETNRIIELSEGRLTITPSPTDRHQRVLGELYFLLRSYVGAKKLGEIRMSPMDTRLWKGKIRQPNIVFMSNEHLDRITEVRWGIPDLVVEVLSKETVRVDREDKYLEYQKAGVQEYWIVDPSKQNIEVCTLENRTYVTFGKWGTGEVAKSKLLASFEVSVDDVME